MGKKGKFELNAVNLLAYIVKRAKILAIISVGAGIITAALSLLLPNMYKSEVILLPAARVSVARTLADINYGVGKGELLSIGEDEELDVLLQVVNSSDIYEILVSKFNLFEHYKIKPSKSASKQLFSRLESNLKIAPTEFNAVRISVWDEDPKIAAGMANTISDFTDSVFTKMERDRSEKAYTLVKNAYDSLSIFINKLEDSLIYYNNLGIFDVRFQSQELTKALYKAQIKGKNDVAKNVSDQISIFKKHAGKFQALQEQLNYIRQHQVTLGGKVAVADIGRKNDMPRKFTVSTARIADYKDKPKRSIIVLVATIAAFFVALFGFIIAENIKKLR